MLIYEKFPDTHAFIRTIDSRPNNVSMSGKREAHESRSDNWAGTKTWEEAVKLYQTGLPDRVVALKTSLRKIQAQCNSVSERTKARPRNYYYGYAPNVPAALAGMPKSMRQTVKQSQKVKTVNIVYDMGISWRHDSAKIEKGGETVLQLVALLEYSGYKVNLDMCPFSAKESSDFALLLVTLKEFKQPLDLLKLSFPLASAAMFRRFGFRWLETVPKLDECPTGKSFSYGYGTQSEPEDTKKQLAALGYKLEQTHVIKLQTCESAEFDCMTLARNLGIII